MLILNLIKTISFANTGIEKVKDNGIYKVALGADSGKVMEVVGADMSNDATVDLWNYRKCSSAKAIL